MKNKTKKCEYCGSKATIELLGFGWACRDCRRMAKEDEGKEAMGMSEQVEKMNKEEKDKEKIELPF